MYEYTIEYCEVAEKAFKNGFVTKEIKNIIDKDIKNKVLSEDVSEAFKKAIKRLHDKVYLIKSENERNKVYLEKLGIKDMEPFEVLYKKKEIISEKRYVTLHLVYPDDTVRYEDFEGRGKSITKNDFIKEYIKENQLKNSKIRIVGCDGPYIKPSYTLYYYKGIYSVPNKEEE